MITTVNTVIENHRKISFNIASDLARFWKLKAYQTGQFCGIGGKCRNWKIQMRHFGWFSNNVTRARRTHNFDLNYCVSITINENNSPQYQDLPLCHEKISLHTYKHGGVWLKICKVACILQSHKSIDFCSYYQLSAN